MKDRYHIFPVGVIKKENENVRIEIDEAYRDALLGLDDFSHITVCYWFHENDTPEKKYHAGASKKEQTKPVKRCVCHPFTLKAQSDCDIHL